VKRVLGVTTFDSKSKVEKDFSFPSPNLEVSEKEKDKKSQNGNLRVDLMSDVVVIVAIVVEFEMTRLVLVKKLVTLRCKRVKNFSPLTSSLRQCPVKTSLV